MKIWYEYECYRYMYIVQIEKLKLIIEHMFEKIKTKL